MRKYESMERQKKATHSVPIHPRTKDTEPEVSGLGRQPERIHMGRRKQHLAVLSWAFLTSLGS